MSGVDTSQGRSSKGFAVLEHDAEAEVDALQKPGDRRPRRVNIAVIEIDRIRRCVSVEEGEEILTESDQTLTAWIENTDDSEALEALQRYLHTLKGGARMAGVLEIGDLGHSIESLLTDLLCACL